MTKGYGPKKILQPFTNPWPGTARMAGTAGTAGTANSLSRMRLNFFGGDLVLKHPWRIEEGNPYRSTTKPWFPWDIFMCFVCWGWLFCCRFKTGKTFWSHTNWSLECISAGHHLGMSLKKPWLRSTWPLTHLITAWDIQANECRGSSNAILEQIGSLLWFLLSTHRSVKEWISWKM